MSGHEIVEINQDPSRGQREFADLLKEIILLIQIQSPASKQEPAQLQSGSNSKVREGGGSEAGRLTRLTFPLRQAYVN